MHQTKRSLRNRCLLRVIESAAHLITRGPLQAFVGQECVRWRLNETPYLQDQPTAAARSAEKSAGPTTASGKEISPLASNPGDGKTSVSGTGAGESDGHLGMMDKVKAAMGGAPWQVGIPELLLPGTS